MEIVEVEVFTCINSFAFILTRPWNIIRGKMGLRYVNHMKIKKIKNKNILAYFIAFVIQVSVDM